MKKKILLIGILFCLVVSGSSQTSSLYRKINSITRDKNATVGVAVIWDNGDTLTVNNNREYPMLSVVKFHLSLGVLHFLEQNGISPDTLIHVSSRDLLPDTYSPLRDLYPQGGIEISVKELLYYSIVLSDNNTCDILFRFVGGVHYIHKYIDSLGIPDIIIQADEEGLHRSFDHQYLNTTTPYATARLVDKLLKKEMLSAEHHRLLMELMTETATGTDKLKALLPENAILGHKTGSSSRNTEGLKAADNDIGFIIKPDSRYYSIAVFVMDSMESDEVNAAMIAEISKAVYDHIP